MSAPLPAPPPGPETAAARLERTRAEIQAELDRIAALPAAERASALAGLHQKLHSELERATV